MEKYARASRSTEKRSGYIGNRTARPDRAVLPYFLEADQCAMRRSAMDTD